MDIYSLNISVKNHYVQVIETFLFKCSTPFGYIYLFVLYSDNFIATKTSKFIRVDFEIWNIVAYQQPVHELMSKYICHRKFKIMNMTLANICIQN